MATQYHTFLGPIANKYTNVIVNIGRDTKSSFVVDVVKMYKEWSNKIRFNYKIINQLDKQSKEEVIQTLSDIYWVHTALKQGITQHGINDKSINNIIALCNLLIEQLTKKSLFNKENHSVNVEIKNTIQYLVDLSVSWCIDNKYPILSHEIKTDNFKVPTVEQVYESASYWCG